METCALLSAGSFDAGEAALARATLGRGAKAGEACGACAVFPDCSAPPTFVPAPLHAASLDARSPRLPLFNLSPVLPERRSASLPSHPWSSATGGLVLGPAGGALGAGGVEAAGIERFGNAGTVQRGCSSDHVKPPSELPAAWSSHLSSSQQWGAARPERISQNSLARTPVVEAIGAAEVSEPSRSQPICPMPSSSFIALPLSCRLYSGV